jgi:ubiquitin carboxyl-terminal hydrolase 7
MTVHEMLGVQYYPNALNTIYYEVLNMTLQEFESKQFVRISYLDGSLKEQGPLDLFVFKTASLGQVLEEVFGQVKRDVHGSGQARIYEVVNTRIYRWPSLEDPVHSIPPSSHLYVEDVPDEELTMGTGDRVVNVIHYSRDVLRGHGVPFQFVIKGVSIVLVF